MNRSEEESKKWQLPRFSKTALLILLAIAVVVTGTAWSKISAAKPTNPIASLTIITLTSELLIITND